MKSKIFIIPMLLISMNCIAQSYTYDCKESKKTPGIWICSTDNIDLSNKCTIAFELYSQTDKTTALSFSTFIWDTTTDRLSNDSKKFIDIDKDKTISIKITLSNGEVLSSTQAIKGLLFNYDIGTQNLYSNKVTLSNGNERNVYSMNLLRNYDITNITVAGYSFPTPNFHSASTIEAMSKTLKEKTGDSGQYGGLLSSNSSITYYNKQGEFGFAGTYRSISPATSSSFKSLKEYIGKNACKNGTLTVSGRGIILKGNNDAIWVNTPNELADEINKRHNEGTTITDVNITENGNWVIIFGVNGSTRHGYPEGLNDACVKANSDRETIQSACFNDNGGYALVGNKTVYGDNPTIDFVNRAKDKFGTIRTVYITNTGKVACCENGVYFENIPKNVVEALFEVSFKPYFFKFTDNGLYLFTDGQSTYKYFM